jgi:hypothetical protein
MGVLYTRSSKSPGPFLKLPKIPFLKIKEFEKKGDRPGLVGDQWLFAGHGATPGPVGLFSFFLNFFSSCLLLFAQVVNSC